VLQCNMLSGDPEDRGVRVAPRTGSYRGPTVAGRSPAYTRNQLQNATWEHKLHSRHVPITQCHYSCAKAYSERNPALDSPRHAATRSNTPQPNHSFGADALTPLLAGNQICTGGVPS
jgi:hypothetical protein